MQSNISVQAHCVRHGASPRSLNHCIYADTRTRLDTLFYTTFIKTPSRKNSFKTACPACPRVFFCYDLNLYLAPITFS